MEGLRDPQECSGFDTKEQSEHQIKRLNLKVENLERDRKGDIYGRVEKLEMLYAGYLEGERSGREPQREYMEKLEEIRSEWERIKVEIVA